MKTTDIYTQPVYVSVTDTAKLVRAALKAAFPAVAFSVRSSKYSGGASIDVTWTDGPTDEQVNAHVGRYQGATFDGSIDLKESRYATDASGRRVRYGADWVHLQRRYSVGVLACITGYVCATYGLDFEPEIRPASEWSGAEVMNASTVRVDDGTHRAVYLNQLIWAECRKTSLV